MSDSRRTPPESKVIRDSNASQNKRSDPGAAAESGPYLCGDIDIRIARDGTWYHEGSPIGRKSLVKLFSTVLRLDDNGDYWLVTPAEKARIEVEDVPFVAVEMILNGKQTSNNLSFRLNNDEIVMADAAHRIRVETDSRTGEPSPYIHVRDGLEARIARPVYYELIELGEERSGGGGRVLGVWSGGIFHELGTLDDET